MIWRTVVSSLDFRDWYEGIVRSRSAPPSFMLEEPMQTFQELHSLIQEGVESVVWPGGVELSLRTGVSDSLLGRGQQDLLLHEALTLLGGFDQRRQTLWLDDLSEEESPAPHVLNEIHTLIEGVEAVGPGGRAVVQRLGSGMRVSVAVRRTTDQIDGLWVDADAMIARLGGALERETTDVRIRARFGYHELSIYETQHILHPAIVVIKDRYDVAEGPRWRVISAERATSTDPGFNGASTSDRITDTCQ